MTHRWIHARVSAPHGTGSGGITRPEPPESLLELVRDMRAADGRSRWFLHWTELGKNPEIGLWASSTQPVLREVESRLLKEVSPYGKAPVVEELREPVPHHPLACDIEFHDDVAMASSELALAVAREPVAPYDAQLIFTIWHLRHVVALIPEAARKGFLFQCWQHWTEGLTPAQRTELRDRGGPAAGALAEGLPAMSGETARRWDDYLRTLRRTANSWAAEGAPVNYLLFDHAHLTHRRLRIPAVTEALAARTVRAVLGASGADTQPIAVPAAGLQTA
ncbi:hypothetical protein GCM10009730_59930 [Streptomyces albidochromogenes]|uniref:hypothetical protein n=1 Tax=Streptomyces albidochromogenes TaxID=329524 RepID=UPI00110FF57F|nr:hypothetical protein [Streptomyces albidochromogenes]